MGSGRNDPHWGVLRDPLPKNQQKQKLKHGGFWQFLVWHWQSE